MAAEGLVQRHARRLARPESVRTSLHAAEWRSRKEWLADDAVPGEPVWRLSTSRTGMTHPVSGISRANNINEPVHGSLGPVRLGRDTRNRTGSTSGTDHLITLIWHWLFLQAKFESGQTNDGLEQLGKTARDLSPSNRINRNWDLPTLIAGSGQEEFHEGIATSERLSLLALSILIAPQRSPKTPDHDGTPLFIGAGG